MARLLYTKPLLKLTEREYDAVSKCNMGTRGSMRSAVEDRFEYSRDKTARVVMCWDKKKLIGCALLFEDHDGRWMIYTYVHMEYRRKGVGTAIIAHSRRSRKTLHACPWDHRSSAFYTPLIEQGKCKNAYAA